MTHDERTFQVTVAGETLQVQRITPPAVEEEGMTLVLLHEALGSIAQWRDFPVALVQATGLPALVYDRCGFGQSQPLPAPRELPYLEREVASLKALLELCDVKRPLLVGHSDGGTLALLFAAAFPGQVEAIISEAAHLFVEDQTLVGIREVVARWEQGDLKQKLERYHGDKTEQVFRAWAGTWLEPGFRSWNIEALMADVTCPVLAIQGCDDRFATVRQLDAICDGLAGRAERCLIEACAHAPHHEARATVLEHVTTFIAGLDGAS